MARETDDEITEGEEYDAQDVEDANAQKYEDEEYEDLEGENLAPTEETPGITELILKCGKCGKTKIVKERDAGPEPLVCCGRLMKSVVKIVEEFEAEKPAGKKRRASERKAAGGKSPAGKRSKKTESAAGEKQAHTKGKKSKTKRRK